MKFKSPTYSKLLFRIALVSLISMSIFRGLLFLQIKNNWGNTSEYTNYELFQSFVMGIRFDIVIVGYVLLIPFVILSIKSFMSIHSRKIIQGVFLYFYLVFFLVLFAFSSDVPFFLQYFSRLTTASLLWFDDSKYMLSLLSSEKSFYLYFLLLLVIYFITALYLKKEKRKFILNYNKPHKINFKTNLVYFILIALIFVIGIRGRLAEKSPIRVGTAYFCNNQMLNKLALNPVFTFANSVINDLKKKEKLNWIKDEIATENCYKYLSIPQSDSLSIKTINNWDSIINSDSAPKNIVLVIMESMGSYKLGKYGGQKNLTPVLNKIIPKSIFFDNIYTSGIHTFNGIYSTLFSFPAIYAQQPLEELIDVPHQGIATVLKNNGYSTTFFSTHDPQFDNVAGFLKANDYDKIYSEFDYPKEWKRSTNGVSDHRMFEYSIPIINKLAASKNAFFTVFMTGSDHKPFVIPKDINFNPKSKTIENQITEYADWSIGNFLKEASAQDWYKNTTFVFIADHGLNMGHTYDMPLSYHHTPFIIYNPSFTNFNDTLPNIGGQIDVTPTILGLLEIEYDNNTLGLNLLKYRRPFMYFCADDKIGCLDDEHYLILRNEKIETLYKYGDLKTTNYIDSFPETVAEMKEYVYSMMQETQTRLTIKK